MNRKLTTAELGRIEPNEYRQMNQKPLVLVLDNLRSGMNVGSIFRSSDAFGVAEIWLCGYTPHPPHREILKTALGATESVPWKTFEHTAYAVQELLKNGFRVFAIEQTIDAIDIREFTPESAQPLALVFGNEVSGVDQEVIDLCHGSLVLPQVGSKHSLNVSVCCGVVLWELTHPQLT